MNWELTIEKLRKYFIRALLQAAIFFMEDGFISLEELSADRIKLRIFDPCLKD